jgi:hypothetical protein
MDYLKFHQGPLCPTNLHPAGGPPLKRPYSHFRDGLQPAACSRLLPTWTPQAVRLCWPLTDRIQQRISFRFHCLRMLCSAMAGKKLASALKDLPNPCGSRVNSGVRFMDRNLLYWARHLPSYLHFPHSFSSTLLPFTSYMVKSDNLKIQIPNGDRLGLTRWKSHLRQKPVNSWH